MNAWAVVATVIYFASAVHAGPPDGQAPDGGIVVDTVAYKRIGDCVIKADVHRRPEGGIRPAIVWIHGGALVFGDRSMLRQPGLHEELKQLLNAGFVVISIDYRLAPETKLPEIIEDLKDAWRWVRTNGATQFQIDPDRIAVAGQSAGGYLTLMAGCCLEPRPRALVSFYGYGDIAGSWLIQPSPFYTEKGPAISAGKARSIIGSAPIPSSNDGRRGLFYLWCRQQGRWSEEVSGLLLEEDPRVLDPYSPVRNVTKGFPPTLLLHGDMDTDVPCEQSLQMAEALTAQGIEHRLIIQHGQGHGFDLALQTQKDVSKTFGEVVDFLNQHLKAAAETEPPSDCPP